MTTITNPTWNSIFALHQHPPAHPLRVQNHHRHRRRREIYV